GAKGYNFYATGQFRLPDLPADPAPSENNYDGEIASKSGGFLHLYRAGTWRLIDSSSVDIATELLLIPISRLE
ncbi:unnamed protein product, partial [marine sediment metagenome]